MLLGYSSGKHIMSTGVAVENYSKTVRILIQVKIYHRFLIGRDDHLDQSETYDISSRSIRSLRYIVTSHVGF